MSTSTYAYLVYGYNLGGGEDAWHFGDWKSDYEQPRWAPPEFDNDEDRYDWDVEGWAEKKLKGSGVELISHGSLDYPSYLLVTNQITGECFDPAEISLPELHQTQITSGWDFALDDALKALGMPRPTGEDGVAQHPAWLLTTWRA